MITKVNIKNPENPLDEKFVEIDLAAGIKIVSDEPYVKEAYAMYMDFTDDPKDFGDIDNNSIAKGKITNVTDTVATVELNKKYSTIIDITKEKKEYLSYIQENAILDLKVNRSRDAYNVSFSNAIQDIKLKEIINSIGKQVAYYAKVVDLIHGGYYLVIDGIKVFMPGSLAGMNKLSNFDDLLNKNVYVMPINYSNAYNMVVVSHREYLKSLKPMELERVQMDTEYNGKVTGCSKFGVFAEFNTDNDLERPFILTGLIPSSEMDDATLQRFNNRDYKPGDVIKFYVKNVVNENKIILTKIFIDWQKTFEEYKQGKTVDCKIVKVQENIIFAVIDNTKLIGTITNYDKDCVVGDIIKLRISKIDINNRKIFMKV